MTKKSDKVVAQSESDRKLEALHIMLSRQIKSRDRQEIQKLIDKHLEDQKKKK